MTVEKGLPVNNKVEIAFFIITNFVTPEEIDHASITLDNVILKLNEYVKKQVRVPVHLYQTGVRDLIHQSNLCFKAVEEFLNDLIKNNLQSPYQYCRTTI